VSLPLSVTGSAGGNKHPSSIYSGRECGESCFPARRTVIHERHASKDPRETREGCRVGSKSDKEFTRRHQNLVNSLVFLFAKHLHQARPVTYSPCCRPLVIDLRARFFFCIFFFASWFDHHHSRFVQQLYHVILYASKIITHHVWWFRCWYVCRLASHHIPRGTLAHLNYLANSPSQVDKIYPTVASGMAISTHLQSPS
jgi:hypothetical protein